jgi:hypothetical protein
MLFPGHCSLQHPSWATDLGRLWRQALVEFVTFKEVILEAHETGICQPGIGVPTEADVYSFHRLPDDVKARLQAVGARNATIPTCFLDEQSPDPLAAHKRTILRV